MLTTHTGTRRVIVRISPAVPWRALEDKLSERNIEVRDCRGLRGRRARDGRVLLPRDRPGADLLRQGSRIRPPRGEDQAVAIASHDAGRLMLADGYGHACSNRVRGTELAFWTRDVAAVFQVAVEAGARALTPP